MHVMAPLPAETLFYNISYKKHTRWEIMPQPQAPQRREALGRTDFMYLSNKIMTSVLNFSVINPHCSQMNCKYIS